MKIKPIRTKKDHKEALARIEQLWSSKKKSDQDELEVLATLVEAYEAKNIEILPPDPVDAITFRMQQLGLSKSEVAQYFGGRNRVSEILSRKRKLTVEMIRNLSKYLEIPAESLIGTSPPDPLS